MRPPIYEPSGPAREYSPLAINTYLECGHGCKYCYVPVHIHKKFNEFFVKSAKPRNHTNMMKELEKQLNKLKEQGKCIKDQVLFSFTSDPYTPSVDSNWITERALEILAHYDVPTAILTKNPLRAYADIHIIKKFSQFQIGTSLTVWDDEDCELWEPYAPKYEYRLQGLEQFQKEGIRTFVSMEPVISPYHSLTILKDLVKRGIGEVVKLGKMNGFWEQKLPPIDYPEYLQKALDILRPSGKGIYVKEDLRTSAPNVQLTDREKDMDFYNLKVN